MNIERRIEALEGQRGPVRRTRPIEFHVSIDAGACLHPRCQGRTSQEQAAIHRGMPTFHVCFDEALPGEGQRQ